MTVARVAAPSLPPASARASILTGPAPGKRRRGRPRRGASPSHTYRRLLGSSRYRDGQQPAALARLAGSSPSPSAAGHLRHAPFRCQLARLVVEALAEEPSERPAGSPRRQGAQPARRSVAAAGTGTETPQPPALSQLQAAAVATVVTEKATTTPPLQESPQPCHCASFAGRQGERSRCGEPSRELRCCPARDQRFRPFQIPVTPPSPPPRSYPLPPIFLALPPAGHGLLFFPHEHVTCWRV